MKYSVILRSLLVLAMVIGISFAAYQYPSLRLSGTARAVGDLTVDWGVPEGDPIFTVTNMAPGDTETRTVNITNNAAVIRDVGIRVKDITVALDLANVLDVVLSSGATDLYGGTSGTGPKTLADFFTEAGTPDGIPLFSLNPGASQQLTMTVTFQAPSGNAFQGGSATFDLVIGVVSAVPPECQNITFDGVILTGTDGRDSLRGTPRNDLLIGLEGRDALRGEGGDDCLVGGLGNDDLRGDGGNDVLIGNEGNDALRGDNGNDHIIGNDGNDQIRGDNGNDILDGGAGNDTMRADPGNDEVTGGPGNDDIRGDTGADIIRGDEGNDQMRGDTGNDTLIGGADTDRADGSTGTDTCEAENEKSCELNPV